MVTAVIETFANQELESASVGGDGETESIGRVLGHILLGWFAGDVLQRHAKLRVAEIAAYPVFGRAGFEERVGEIGPQT